MQGTNRLQRFQSVEMEERDSFLSRTRMHTRIDAFGRAVKTEPTRGWGLPGLQFKRKCKRPVCQSGGVQQRSWLAEIDCCRVSGP